MRIIKLIALSLAMMLSLNGIASAESTLNLNCTGSDVFVTREGSWTKLGGADNEEDSDGLEFETLGSDSFSLEFFSFL